MTDIKTHKHAALIKQWADDPSQKVWFYCRSEAGWCQTSPPQWSIHCDYALGDKPPKPPMILCTLAGLQFPMPETVAPRDLLDDDGENRAVRSFLLAYGGTGIDAAVMKRHMANSGYPESPEWVESSPGWLTKAGAQIWLRMLFGMEGAALPLQAAQAGAEPGCQLPPLLTFAHEVALGTFTSDELRPAALRAIKASRQPPTALDETEHVPNSLGGFLGSFASSHDRQPSDREVWDAAMRSFVQLYPNGFRAFGQ